VDVGCGEGALLNHLEDEGYTGSYQGEDILEGMVDRARQTHPSANFLVRDSLECADVADAVVCCGALNTGIVRTDGHQQSLAQLWTRARRVLVVVVAVEDRHHGGAMLTPVHLGDLWASARSLTTCSAVREDLNAGEAMLTLWRDRTATLERLLGGDEHAVNRAEVYAAAQEPYPVLETLGHLRSTTPAAAVRWAVAAAGAGRLRDAETALRDLVQEREVASEAQLALASILITSGRQSEAVALLTALSGRPGPARDSALMLLVRHHLGVSDPDAACDYAHRIEDPWVKREADALLQKT
jgi:SAM-dependent methyltransferase